MKTHGTCIDCVSPYICRDAVNFWGFASKLPDGGYCPTCTHPDLMLFYGENEELAGPLCTTCLLADLGENRPAWDERWRTLSRIADSVIPTEARYSMDQVVRWGVIYSPHPSGEVARKFEFLIRPWRFDVGDRPPLICNASTVMLPVDPQPAPVKAVLLPGELPCFCNNCEKR